MRGIRRGMLLWLFAVTIGASALAGCAEDGEEGDLEALEEDADTSGDATLDAQLGPQRDAAPARPDAEPDASVSELDASDALDASVADAALMDASGPDAGTGPMDASAEAGSDAGKDGGVVDAGRDAGAPDAGKDASIPDASIPDASIPDASIPDASAPNTFSSVYIILSSQCAGCHGSSGGLSLVSKQRAYDELTGGPLGPSMGLAEGQACSGAGRRRVIPGDANNSLIIQKLSGSPPCGDAMPPGDTLPAAAIAEIRAWIAAGALNN